jgi:hypothetical protein
MECFKFGSLTNHPKGGQIGQFALHLQCPWRITQKASIVVGSQDLYEPADQEAPWTEDFNWDVPNANLRDKKLANFFMWLSLVVTDVTTDEFGGFILHFSHGINLWAFPAHSKVGEYAEHWRLIDNTRTEDRHFVVSGPGQ